MTARPARPAWVETTARRVYDEQIVDGGLQALYDLLPDARNLAACQRYLADVELPTADDLAAIEADVEYQHGQRCSVCIARPQDTCPELEAIRKAAQADE